MERQCRSSILSGPDLGWLNRDMRRIIGIHH